MITSIGPSSDHPRFAASALIMVPLTVALAAPALGQDASCTPVVSAFARLAQTPNHQFTEQRGPAGAGRTESITTGTTRYIRTDGKWVAKPFSPAAEIMEEAARARSEKSTCRFIRDENVDGVAAGVYSVQTQADYGSSETKLWIAKANGLPVREEIKLKLAKVSGKARVEVRFIYAGVAAPPGAQ
jgi:hypothetical protein